jgi:hypothetical protein
MHKPFKICNLRREMVKFSKAEWRRKLCLKTGIFRKFPARPWYICLVTLNIHSYLDVCVYIRKEFHGHETPSFCLEAHCIMRMQQELVASKFGKSKNVNSPLQRVIMAKYLINTPETPKSLQIHSGC